MSLGNFLKSLKQLYEIIHVVVEVGKWLVDIFERVAPPVADWWNGKKIAIIGPTAVGKDSLFSRLQGKPIPAKHINTTALEDIPKFKLQRQLPDGRMFEISVKRSSNVGGEKEQRDRFWLEACKGADIIFYMLTLDDIERRRYKGRGRVRADLQWLAQNLGQMYRNPKIHFLVNKIDTRLKDSTDYDAFIERLSPIIADFLSTADTILGRYKTRNTGISPTSMLDEGIFGRSFIHILESVYDAVHPKKATKDGLDSA